MEVFDTLPQVLRPVSGDSIASTIFVSDKNLSVTKTSENIVWDKDSNESLVYLKQGCLNPPMGGVSFNMNPVLVDKHDMVVSVGVRYSVMFPTDFHWNQGGHLPGLFGSYALSGTTSATASNLFEGKCRWDAKGRLGVSIKQNFEHDPFEWKLDQQDKVQLVRGVWYDICLVAHIDGAFQVLVNGCALFVGTTHLGFERLDGVRFCAYCVDNLGQDDMYILFKNLEIKAKIDSE